MSEQKNSEKLKSANDNVDSSNPFYMECLRDINNGKHKSYLHLAVMYEEGYGVKKNVSKALDMREKYYNAYRKLVSDSFDVIEFLIETGNKYMLAGNKYRAAEWYLEAATYIMSKYQQDIKKRERTLKKYRIETLLKKTGYQHFV